MPAYLALLRVAICVRLNVNPAGTLTGHIRLIPSKVAVAPWRSPQPGTGEAGAIRAAKTRVAGNKSLSSRLIPRAQPSLSALQFEASIYRE